MKANYIGLLLGLTLSMISLLSAAQGGQKWSLGGNSTSSGDFIGTTNNSAFVIKTNNTERLVFAGNGDIRLYGFGIGSAGLLGTDAAGSLFKINYNNDPNTVLTGDGHFKDINTLGIITGWKLNGQTVYTETGWKVGVGTPTPGAALDVNGNAIVRGTLHVYDGIIIGKTYTGEKATLDTVEATKMQADEMKATSYKTNTISIDGNNSLITSATGQISFGNNSISAGTITTGNMNVQGNTTFTNLSVTQVLRIGVGTLYLTGINTPAGPMNSIYTSNGDLKIQCDATNNYNTIINANNTGYVGIGTETPQQNLHVKGSTNLMSYVEDEEEISSASLSAVIRLEDVAYNAPAILSHLNRTAHWDISASAGRKGLFFGTDDGLGGDYQHVIMVLKESTGNVGIGVVNPTEKLHVMGGQSPVFMKVQNQIGYVKVGFNGAHGIIDSDHRLQLNYYSGQDVVVGGQAAGAGSFYSMHNSYLAYDDGQVAIGCSEFDPGAKLTVKGKITAEDVEVKQLNYPDYVFGKDYKLMTFEELRVFIEVNKHLPNVPSASEVAETGLSVSDNSRVQMEKIEELTLYILQIEQRLKELESIVNKSKNQ